MLYVQLGLYLSLCLFTGKPYLHRCRLLNKERTTTWKQKISTEDIVLCLASEADYSSVLCFTYHSMRYLKGREKELCVALDQVHGGQQQGKRKLCSLSAVASAVCPLFFFLSI